MTGKRYIWMTVTNDKFEYPLLMENTAKKLAQKLGVTENTIKSAVWNYENNGKGSKYGKFRRVIIDENDEFDDLIDLR